MTHRERVATALRQFMASKGAKPRDLARAGCGLRVVQHYLKPDRDISGASLDAFLVTLGTEPAAFYRALARIARDEP